MFLGKFSGKLDANNRFLVPPGFRERVASGVYIAQGFDQNLQVLMADAFQELHRRVMSLNLADPLTRLLLRMILGTASEIKMDKSGFIVIPSELKDYADLHEEILLIGQGEYFEIWAPDLWSKQEIQLKDVEANSSRFSTLTVAIR